MRSSSRLQTRFGLRRVYILGCSVYALGFVLWGSVSDPTILAGLTMLEGVAFSLLFTTAVVIVGRLCRRNLYSTGNAVTGMVGFGIAPIIGAGIGGFVYQRLGPGVLYGAAAVLAVAAAVVAWFALDMPVLGSAAGGRRGDRSRRCPTPARPCEDEEWPRRRTRSSGSPLCSRSWRRGPSRPSAPVGPWTPTTSTAPGSCSSRADAYAAERLRAQIRVLPELAAELSAIVPGAGIHRRRGAGDGLPQARRAAAGSGARRVVAGAARAVPVRPAPDAAGVRRSCADEPRLRCARSCLRRSRRSATTCCRCSSPTRPSGSARRFTAFLDDEDYWRFSPCLTHGDSVPSTCSCRRSGDLVGVLDWEELTWAIPSRTSRGCSTPGRTTASGCSAPTAALPTRRFERCGVPVLPHAVPRGGLRAAERAIRAS